MKQEVIASGKTVEAAILNGAKELGVDRSLVTFDVIEPASKGFLGFGEKPAQVRVCYEAGIESVALDYIETVSKNIELNAAVSVSEIPGNEILVKVEGVDSGLLIGHHGETLDALQCLVNLVVNKKEEGTESGERNNKYSRVVVDVEDYRSKREETLRELAKKMAQKALKYKKPISLEPMNPHERKIIHSEIQNIDGVTTSSVGHDSSRRIIVYPEGVAIRSGKKSDGNTDRRRSRKHKSNNEEKPVNNNRTEEIKLETTEE